MQVSIDRLKHDHQVLRTKLGLLESALTMGLDAWFVIRELCYGLLKRLQDHIQHEHETVSLYQSALGEPPDPPSGAEHGPELNRLWTATRAMLNRPEGRLDEIRPALTELISELRRHMAEQESAWYPAYERAVAIEEPPDTELRDSMTVNALLRKHPKAGAVLARYRIDPSVEGYDCLDEVAWRRGLESQVLLAELRVAIEGR